MNWKFCMLCGGELTTKGDFAWQCQACGQRIYKNAAATADAAIVNEKNELLIAIRAIDPGKGKWDLPGGFVDIGETSEQALERELKEELAFSLSDAEEVEYIRSGDDEYHWGKDITYVLAASFLVKVSSSVKFEVHDDVSEIMWVHLSKISPEKLFFAPHQKVIEELKRRLL